MLSILEPMGKVIPSLPDPQGPSEQTLPGLEVKSSKRPKDDPLAKPTWEEWKRWDQYRRLLNDCRLRSKAEAFRIWHWLHNNKDAGWRSSGEKTQAWYIARKFNLSRQTVYKCTDLLVECGYLAQDFLQGCVKVFRVLGGINELPDSPQKEFPFILPAKDSGCPPKLTPEQSGCIPNLTPGVAPYEPGCAPKLTPGVKPGAHPICDSSESVNKECEGTGPPTLVGREPWKIIKEMRDLRQERERFGTRSFLRGHKAERYDALVKMIDGLQAELTGVKRPESEKPSDPDYKNPRNDHTCATTTDFSDEAMEKRNEAREAAASPPLPAEPAPPSPPRVVEELEGDDDYLLELCRETNKWRIVGMTPKPGGGHVIRAERVTLGPEPEPRQPYRDD